MAGGVTREQFDELLKQFNTIDADGNGYIDATELKAALEVVGFKIPQYKVRVMVDEMDANRDGRLSYDEFEALCKKLKSTDIAGTFRPTLSKRQDLLTHGGMSQASSEDTTHSVRLEEQVAFSNWINSNLGRDPDCKNLLPIDEDGTQLYEKVADGILMCKLINLACPDTIDERAINKKNLNLYTRHENLTLAVNSAESIGCNIVNIDADDLSKGKPHLVLGLLWQIIRIGLFNQITLEQCPGMIQLLRNGEKIEDLMRLAPEQILLRWVNYHLEAAGIERRMNNFTSDVKDSEIYTHLLHQLAKNGEANLSPLQERDMLRRAELMLKMADRMKCRSFVTARDVVEGIYKLNVAFVANLFNTHPGLTLPEEAPQELKEILSAVEETREEKTYRNWLNSLGVDPFAHHLYTDLSDGLIIFQLYDIIKPGIVNWKKVVRKFNRLRAFIEKVENCNYAVQLGKQLNFSLVGIAGQDISQGNPTLTMALIWQLMRAYTLSILTNLAGGTNPIGEKEIIGWVNSKLKDSNKSSRINSFQDPSLSGAMPVIDLIDAIKPGSIRYDQVNPNAGSHEDRLANAKYAISIARKCGARIYALPEDIVECKPKMVMTVFACLMGLDYKPNMNLKQQQQSTPVSESSAESNYSTPSSSVSKFSTNTSSSTKNVAESMTKTNNDAVAVNNAVSSRSITPQQQYHHAKTNSVTSSASSSRAEIITTTVTETVVTEIRSVGGTVSKSSTPIMTKQHNDNDDMSSTRDSLSPDSDHRAQHHHHHAGGNVNSSSGADGGYDSVVGGSAASVDGEISTSSSAASSAGDDGIDSMTQSSAGNNGTPHRATNFAGSVGGSSDGGVTKTTSSSTLSTTNDFIGNEDGSSINDDEDGNESVDDDGMPIKPVGVFGTIVDDYADNTGRVQLPPSKQPEKVFSKTSLNNGGSAQHHQHHRRQGSADSGDHDSQRSWNDDDADNKTTAATHNHVTTQ